jgi:hypothetical protein
MADQTKPPLTNDEIITLNSPSSILCSPMRVNGDWYVRHSTRSIWRGKRNVQINGVHDPISKPADGSPQVKTPKSLDLPFSYQEEGEAEVRVRVETGWKELGEGRDGKLKWFWKKTPYGIEDSSGRSSLILFLSHKRPVLVSTGRHSAKMIRVY